MSRHPQGQQPTVKTSGKRKVYEIFGLIDYLSGWFIYKGHAGRFRTTSYQTFLSEVMAQTDQHLVIVQDGAEYHTSNGMVELSEEHPDR
jgi:hypothetical protein